MGKQFGEEILSKVLELEKEGYSHRMVAEELGYTKAQIKELVRRNRRNQREIPIVPAQRGRPRIQRIRKCHEKTDKTYGYRRVGFWLEKQGFHVNHKKVYRLMEKYGLLSEVRRRRKYRQMQEQLHRYPNLLNRNFTASRPNEKWVTDISYVITPQGTLYLSMIRALFDNSIIAYKTGIEQSINLALKTIREAMRKEPVAAELQLHGDQGFQYTSQA